jgi:tRNA(Ile)-lysidine synthase
LGQDVCLIRPLLDFRRDELRAYLKELKQPFRDDPTNQDPRFTRNRLRADLLPRLEAEYNPRVIEALVRLGTLAGEAQEVIERRVESRWEECVTFERPAVVVAIHTAALADETRYLVQELLIAVWRRQGWPRQAMDWRHWRDLAQRIQDPADHGPWDLPGNVRAVKRDGVLRLRRT